MKVPYELLNKRFRSVQKVVDREVSHVSSTLSDIALATDKGCQSDITSALDILVQKLTSLKKKASLECLYYIVIIIFLF